MAFGQPSGPPASARQMADLLRLLQAAGHVGFRDARGPMGFTQRQGGGKFTIAEATAFIGQLEEADVEEGTPAPPPSPTRRPALRPPTAIPSLRLVPAEQLAAELRRRGWDVTSPV